MNKIRIGIAGYGKMGKIRERSILDSDSTELVAIYDVKNFKCSKNSLNLNNLKFFKLFKFEKFK